MARKKFNQFNIFIVCYSKLLFNIFHHSLKSHYFEGGWSRFEYFYNQHREVTFSLFRSIYHVFFGLFRVTRVLCVDCPSSCLDVLSELLSFLRIRFSRVLFSFKLFRRSSSRLLLSLCLSVRLLLRLSPLDSLLRLLSLLLDDLRELLSRFCDADRDIDCLPVSSISGLSDQRQLRFFVVDEASSSSQLKFEKQKFY